MDLESGAKTFIKVPPDGGWGWIIVIASALSNIIVIPIMQNFGLLFKDKFVEIGISATDASIIINVNSAFGMALGLINGPVLRMFGYRRVAFFGAVLIIVGVISTAWAETFTHFIITYSIITSLGMSVVTASFSLAINSFFKKKRSKAMGLAMTLTGMGPVFMPLLISELLQIYGVQGATLIIGAIAMHSLVASLLLHPIKWHWKLEEVIEPPKIVEEKCADAEVETNIKRQRTYTESSIDYDLETASIYGYESATGTPRKVSLVSDGTLLTSGRRRSLFNRSISQPYSRSVTSINSINLGSSFSIFDDNRKRYLALPSAEDTAVPNEDSNKMNGNCVENKTLENKKKRSCLMAFLIKIVRFFDLDLLKDPIYVNLMLGMSIAIFAEINFSLLTAFILSDLNFTTKETATIMSIIGMVDIVFRFISPYVGDYLKFSAQVMYMISLFLLIAGRSCILFFTTYEAMVMIAIFLGVGKGFRTVYMVLVIPNYVPIERLASASGIQMVTNGIILLILGPLLGVIRDRTGSYDLCIIFINVVTFVTICMWSVQLIWMGYKRRNRKEQPT